MLRAENRRITWVAAVAAVIRGEWRSGGTGSTPGRDCTRTGGVGRGDGTIDKGRWFGVAVIRRRFGIGIRTFERRAGGLGGV